MRTINIKGKEYVLISERIKAFRQVHADWTIQTNIVEMTAKMVVIRAEIRDPSGRIISDGYAHEDRDSSYINKTSYLENAQTSAIGRALGIMGIGIDCSIASAEEVLRAMDQQKEMQNGQKKNQSVTQTKNPDGVIQRPGV